MIKIKIDGKALEVKPKTSIIEVADKVGIDIPRFCYHKKLSVAANCRMCLVEVKNFAKPLPACATQVMEGMEISTKSKFTKDTQKSVMEFLLINHPLDCPICDQGGECDLQDTAVAYGASKTRYTEEKRVVFDKNIGPLISTDLTRCIQCTRCVRFLKEVGGMAELGLIGRGEHAEISAYVDKSVESELSGNIIDLCPVGALTSKPFRYSARSWELSRRSTIACHDSLGSNIEVHVKDDVVKRVIPKENESINECWISDRDRFSYEGLSHKDRINLPLKREKNQWKEIDWEEAYELIEKNITDIDIKKSNKIGIICSPQSTLEEGFLLKKIAKELNTSHIDYRLLEKSFSENNNWLGCKIDEIESHDAILVVGSNLKHDQPLLAHRFRRYANKRNNFSIITSYDDFYSTRCLEKVIVNPSAYINYLLMILKQVQLSTKYKINSEVIRNLLKAAKPSTEAKRIAKSLLSNKSRAIFLGNQILHLDDGDNIKLVAMHIAQALGATFGLIPGYANSVGLNELNLNTDNISADKILSQKKEAYIMMNFDPLYDYHSPKKINAALKKAKFNLAISPYISDSFKEFDIVLPMTPFTETSGTFINMEKTIQSFSAVTPPVGQSRPGWKILRVLANFLQLEGFSYDSSEEVKTDAMIEMDQKNEFSLNDFKLSNIERGIEVLNVVRANDSDMIVRRATSLHQNKNKDQSCCLINPTTMLEEGLIEGQKIKISSSEAEILINVKADDNVCLNAVVIYGKQDETFILGMHNKVKIKKA
ncbi:MAG: NADH-quinone oxidoreductase subunit NuoG [Methylophilaceae bacterium]|nr:NADH-quinone oxidoreductase subunit NuoG [Methylophilaceae bacterium]